MTDKIDTRFLFRMTDDTGLFQHSVLGIPNPKEGYTSDDNARALILAAMLFERSPETKYVSLMNRYLSFLLYSEKGRWFRNFLGYDRKFTEKHGSEDCFGRCILALSYLSSRQALPAAIRGCAEKLLQRTAASCSILEFPKAKAYALTGLSLSDNPDDTPLLVMLRDSLADTYLQNRRENWRWFEDKVTYCGGILPLAILCSCHGRDQRLKIGFESLNFLLDNEIRDGVFFPVGCKGWFTRGKVPAVYDEQPVEACSLMVTCLKAYKISGSEKYWDAAKYCFQWYLGQNIAGASMIDPETGGCRDGITRYGINGNEGAESIVCWLTAALLAEREGWMSSLN
jgi:hypothetical protein